MSEKTAVLPICPFGNVLFYSHYVDAHVVFFDAFEHYQKQTFRNRYEILGPNGRQRLTIPVVGQKGKKIPVSDIEIDYREDWPTIHWRSIVTAYHRSPYFEFFKEELEKVLFTRPTKLIDFNLSTHELLKTWLEMADKEHITSEFFENEVDMDLRENFKPSKVIFENREYLQVFSDRHSFAHNLSILDLIFNLGPEGKAFLRS